MKAFTLNTFNQLLHQTSLKPRIKSELRFTTSTQHITKEEWDDLELLAITDRTGVKGILLLQAKDKIYVIAYELSRNITDKATGRSKPIICDFCHTWQKGSNAASITFPKGTRALHSISYLCCADLNCSSHVRTKTDASLHSRAQLRENLTNEQRIERLQNNLKTFIDRMELATIAV